MSLGGVHIPTVAVAVLLAIGAFVLLKWAFKKLA